MISSDKPKKMTKNANIANFMFHAMRLWENCQVYWMVDLPIDSPEMWLDEDIWATLSKRFSVGSGRPKNWPKPDIVSICTSPEFVEENLLERLLQTVDEFKSKKSKKKKGNPRNA